MRLMVGLAVTAVGLVLTTIGRLTIRGVQADLAIALARLPNRVEDGLLAIAQILASLVPTVATVYMLAHRRFRLFLTLVGVGLAAIVVMAVFDTVVQDRRLAEVLADFNTTAGGGFIGRDFPSSSYVAAATAIVTVASPWLSRRWRRAAWGGIAVIVLLRLAVSIVPAVDVLLALGVGTVVGSIALLLLGSPSSEPDAPELVEALQRSGFDPAGIVRTNDRAGGPSYHLTTVDGRRCFVKLRTPHDRDADLLNRMYRAARFRSASLGSPFASLKRQVEHEALLLGIAERAGVRTPQILGLGVTSGGSAFLVEQLAPAAPAKDADLADIDKLCDLWHQVARLHRAGVSHRRLALQNVLVDDDGGVWLVDFDESETAAEPNDLARDVAELLVVSAMAGGPQRAVDAAVSAMGMVAVAGALAYLQPLALSSETRRRVRGDKDLLPELRDHVRVRTGAGDVQLERLERIKPKTLLIILASTLAFYSLLPQLANLEDTADTFGSAEPEWLVAAVVASAVTYLFATVSFVGSVPEAVPYVPALRSRLASSFTSLVAPANVGVLGFSVRFLERSGVDVVNATGAVALNTLAGLIVHLTMMLGFILWTGRSGVGGFSLPDANTVLLVATVLLAGFGIATLFRPFRSRVLRPAVRSAMGAASGMGQVFRSPARVFALFGGAAGLTLTYVVALVCSVEAFGGSLSFPQIGAAYLVAMALATFAPTPGALGAIEAALIAALTGFGLPDGIAVSSVLTFRLATFWLPIAPGWATFTWMQRNGEL
jgi:undecaprenyl-diphosphatase